MSRHHTSVIYTIFACCLLLLLTACGDMPQSQPAHTALTQAPSPTSPPLTATSVPSPTPTVPAPTHYSAHTILSGRVRPDDLALDTQGRLLFSDFYNSTISRLNADGTVTILLKGVGDPEGLVVLPDGTLIIADQHTQSILSVAVGSTTPKVLRVLPGKPAGPPCKDGVDGIALDQTNNTLIIPDSPTGEVYRMSLDGTVFTRIASGIPRPVGAAVDSQGNVYVADECGGSLWTIKRDGSITRMTGFGKLDDVVLDTHGNALVIDLQPAIHALIRVNLQTGKREILASRGFIEPQGLLIDNHDNIYMSDDYADKIVEYTPS